MTKRTLRLKITLYFLIVALLPFASISILTYLQAGQSISDSVEENLSNLSHEIGNEVERTVFSAYTNIKSLSQNPIVQSESVNVKDKLREMRKVQDYYKVFEDITLVDPDGVVLGSTMYDYRGEWGAKSWFKEAKAGKVVVSPVHAILSPFRLVVIVTAPVIDKNGTVIAVIGGQVNMDRIWGITDRVKLGRTGFVFLTDREGNLIACPDKNKLLYKLTPGSFRNKILSGMGGIANRLIPGKPRQICYYDILKGYQDYLGQGWRIGLMQDTREAFSFITKMRESMTAVAAVGLFFILILAGLLSVNLTRPIRALNKMAGRIAEGNLDYRLKPSTGDEIGDLTRAFNKMAGDLKQSTVSIGTLRESEKRFQDVAESTGEWIWEVDARGKYIYSSPVVEKVLGYKPEEVIDKYFYDFFQPQERGMLKKAALDLFAKKKAFDKFPSKLVKKDGDVVEVETTGIPIISKDGKLLGYRGADRDVTEVKGAQESQRLAQLGELVSDMAHEVNNPLQIMSGRAQITAMNKSLDEETMESMDIILDQCQRAKSIVQRLLMFSKPSKEEVKEFNINEAISFAVSLIEHQLSLKKVKITTNFTSPNISIKADEKQMQEIFLNLLRNAADAMPEGGDIIVSTYEEEDKVKINFTDTGEGIPKENLEKIFDPFFTTKEQGTGLGLSVCQGIIRAHGGELKYTSEVGKGTTAMILLPGPLKSQV